MMEILRYLWIVGLSLALCACSSDGMPVQELPSDESGEYVSVDLSVNIPDLMSAPTRGIIGDKPGSGLKLTLLEFSKGTDGANSFLTNIYKAETSSATNVDNGGLLNFKVTLMKTSEPRVLHLLVAEDFVNCDYGSEANLLPRLTVGGSGYQSEAYWGKVIFDNGYATAADMDGNATLLPEVEKKLTGVPVIRNFSRVTVRESLDNFELYGFVIVNVPTSGTIVPWNQSDLSTPNLLGGADGKSMLSYPEIGDSYSGYTPATAAFDNQESEVKSWTDGNVTTSPFTQADKYIYEHPFESGRHTYVIIKGVYNRSGTPTYYKIDLGYNDENYSFHYYNLIRNISYNVSINGVSAAGAATVAEAIDGVSYNNISADVKTGSMLNVSDGQNMLIVSNTNNVFVKSSDTFRLTYQYIMDVTGANSVDNSKVRAVGLAEGDVIKSFSETEEGEFKVITITPNEPTAVTKIQSFKIVDGNGLERTISLVLRVPWDFSDYIFQEGKNNEPQGSDSQNISSSAGGAFTFYFNLPDGIPESVFPLQFKIEANPQCIENNPIGTLAVSTGESLFTPGTPAISYIKTVSWQEYLYKYGAGDGNDVDVNVSNPNHTVRCRFRTISTGTGIVNVAVYNPYFNMGNTSFTRR